MLLGAYSALFLSAFGAATLLPLQSEAVLVGLLLNGAHSPWALLLVATFGNVLGSVVNWVLGRYLERWRERRWFPVHTEQLDKAQAHYHRYGLWSFGLSWLDYKFVIPRSASRAFRAGIMGGAAILSIGRALPILHDPKPSHTT